jgi:Zn-dependent protease with chaperone function
VAKARGIYGLHLMVAILGAAATLFTLGVVASAVTLNPPSHQSLLDACSSFVLPKLTVASLLVLALGSAAFSVLLLAVRSGFRQIRARRRFFAGLNLLRPAPVGPPGTFLFADSRPQAFCAGLFRPRIYLSDATLALLSPAELDAVLAHESHHASYRDPLRIFFARMLSDALFFLPVLRRLSDRYAALAELAADSAAVRRRGNDSRPLASALLAFDEAASPAVVGIAPERVDHLLGERPRWELPVALLAWAVVVVGAIIVVTIRTADATAHTTLNLPLVASQLCMLTMAVIPLLVGAGALLAGRDLVRRTRPAGKSD